MSDSTFHYAEEYLQRGYSVIPLIGKIPPPRFRWAQYQRRRTTLAEIRTWFGSASGRRYDVGIVTGTISGITVVDLDSREDVNWWMNNFAPTPLTVITGRGGAHMYYRANEATLCRNRTGVLGRRIDIRSDGGYVVAPPSIHPVTQRVYRWAPSRKYCLDDIPTFDPTWPDLRVSSSGLTVTKSTRYSTRIQNGPAYISHIYAVSGQGGHNATFRAACYLREAGMSPDEALRALTAWNETNCQPAWSSRELEHKVRDAYAITTRP